MMKKLRSFLYVVKSSVIDIQFYKKYAVNYSAQRGIIYLFALQIFLTAVLYLATSTQIFFSLPKGLEQAKSSLPVLSSIFPPDLTLQFSDKKLVHNQKNPVYIDLNPSVTGFDPKTITQGKKEHFLTIDTSDDALTKNHSSMFLMTKSDFIIFSDAQATPLKYEDFSSAKLEANVSKYLVNGMFTKESFEKMLNDMLAYLQANKISIALIICAVLLVGMSFASILMTILMLLGLLIMAILVFLTLKLATKAQANFKEVFVLLIYASTAPVLLQFFFAQTVTFGIFVLILLIYTFYIWQQIIKGKVHEK